jgi:hypothetical protein
MNQDIDFIEKNPCHKSPNEINSTDCLHRSSQVSIDPSIRGTIREDSEPNRDPRLFPSNLDTILKDESLGKTTEVLVLLKDSIQNLNERLSNLEMNYSRRSPGPKRLDWTEITSLAELRIAEKGGKISQKELQKSLEIGSRTTMTYLVSFLKSTGRYMVWRKGRINIIEAIE